MKICRVEIENYRNLKHVDVELGRIMTLIGENNSGKSNFLRALSIPLSSDDGGTSKRLSWYDINKQAKQDYYDFLKTNKQNIIDNALSVEELQSHIPCVMIKLLFQPENYEHYSVKDILVDEEKWIGGVLYKFFIKKPNELLERVRTIMIDDQYDESTQMSLLPIELFEYSITVPNKGNRIPYDILTNFRSVILQAERDDFVSNVDRLGSKALSDLLQKGLTPKSVAKIEKAYAEFFRTVKTEGKLDSVINWQDYSDIPNAQDFFKHISILPNMPQMSSIIGSIRLGYQDDNMFTQGLGHRNLILITVILNSYLSQEKNISFRLLTVEEPEAHLCNSNILLMASLFNLFSQKNKYTQIVYSTHNVEFVNKVGLDNVIVFHKGCLFNLGVELTETERDYLTANPNIDIFKLLYSKRVILVEGITEELLIKSYLQTRQNLQDIKVISFHKGFTKIIDIWKKINIGSDNKLGVVRDFDNQPKAQENHETRQDEHVIVRTTKGYTLETEITNANYNLLKEKYGELYGWSNLTADQLQLNWRNNKSDVMLRISHDLVLGELDGFIMPSHIMDVLMFLIGEKNEC